MNPCNSRTPILRSHRSLLPYIHFPTLFFLSMVIPPASPLSFNFPDFSQNPSGMVYQGDAFPNQGIQLTKNQVGSAITNSSGRAVYSQPVLLWDSATGELTDFTTHFSFVIKAVNGSGYGDGLTFFLSPYPSIMPPDSTGGSLGLFDRSSALNTSANRMVAVEFDTFRNDFDPSSDHIGIDINSIASAANVTWNSSMNDGSTANAWVSYNASTQNLSVFLTYASNPILGGKSSLFHIVDLRKILPETVSIGFSAATGQSIETHTILSWDFSSTLEPRKKSKVGLVVGLAVGAVG